MGVGGEWGSLRIVTQEKLENVEHLLRRAPALTDTGGRSGSNCVLRRGNDRLCWACGGSLATRPARPVAARNVAPERKAVGRTEEADWESYA